MDYEDYLFHKYKDKIVHRKEFVFGICSKFSGVDGSKIYNKIINYQIKRYGAQLNTLKDSNLIYDPTLKRGWKNRKYRRYKQGIRKNIGE